MPTSLFADVSGMAKKTYTTLFRAQFVSAWFRTCHEVTFIEHCSRFGVTRQTAYEWLSRYAASGHAGLQPKSSAPHRVPHATDAEIVKLIIEARERHPTWGPRTLRAWLDQQTPWKLDLPAPSTMGDILKRAGLVSTKKRRRRSTRFTTPFVDVRAPNDVWTTDFKGHFRMRDGHYCYPLTLVDCFSRFILRCDAYRSTSSECHRSFASAFIEYGMPRAIRSDNGSPFATNSLAGLSRLSVWWIRLGIVPERIAPASPWENGSHERMHRTLEEATDPPQANLRQQQRAFDAFREPFNTERPHQALAMQTPASLYRPSPRSYPRTLPELEYPQNYQLRRVSDVGVISWEGRRLFLSTVLRGEVIGLKQTSDTCSQLYFGPIVLGTLDSTTPDAGLLPVDE